MATTSLHIDTARTWRGGQGQVRHTVMGLRARGHRAILVAHPQGELLRRMSDGDDLIPLAPRHEIDLAAAWRLSRVLAQVRPDVVHANDPHAAAMAAVALAMRAPVPRPMLVLSRRIEYRIARNAFSRWKYSQADCVIAVSAAVRDRIVADGIPRERTAIVHEGVDVDRIARLPPASVHAAFHLPVHVPVVGTIGALVPQKAQHYLIEATALMVREVPDIRLVVLGEGELRHALEDQIRRLHLQRHVLLGGFHTNVLELLKTFDVFALSSIQEGMCTALIDAMAAGRPAVAAAVGGVPEVVVDGDTGYLVPPRQPHALAEKIVRLLKDPLLRDRMGDAGLARARARFTVDRMVDGTIAVYTGLLARRSAR